MRPGCCALTEPLQRSAWDLLIASVGPAAADGADGPRLGMSREHLSRQFGAGGAPNLKRVSDLPDGARGTGPCWEPRASALHQVTRLLG